MTKRDPLLGDLSSEQLVDVMKHPAQFRNLQVVEYLLTQLDACSSLDEYFDFQGLLIEATLKVHRDAGEIDQQERRSLQGKGIKGLTDWPLAFDPATATPADWAIERIVAGRVLRQIRAVGDTLAWRAFGYDRGSITVLASNQSPGRITNKTGLNSELQLVFEAWKERKCFALLHDLTSVLRIGDVTEFALDGSRQIFEVKSSANAKTARQRRRMHEAIDAIEGRGPLPKIDRADPTFYLYRSAVPLRADFGELRKLIDRAACNGDWSGRVGPGRVAGVLNLLKLAEDSAHDVRLAEYHSNFGRAVAKHLHGTTQHVEAVSTDYTARRADLAPFGIFPLPVATRAQLICDYLVLNTRVAVEAVAQRLEKQGLRVDVPLPLRNSQHTGSKSVIHIYGDKARLTLHGHGLHSLLVEFVNLDCFAAATADIIAMSPTGARPLLMFAAERQVWR
jgi:hypothetical protein